MRITLTGRFNNPNLPVVPIPGFYDNFGPEGGPVSSASLGTTSRENRPWQYNVDPWARTDQNTAQSPGGIRRVAYTNGYSTDGELTATIHTPGADGQYGLAFRYNDADNYNYFAYNATLGYFFVMAVVNGDRTTVGSAYTPPTPPAAGHTFSVVMQGDQVYCYHNNAEAAAITITENSNAQNHGLLDHNARTHFDSIEFTPA